MQYSFRDGQKRTNTQPEEKEEFKKRSFLWNLFRMNEQHDPEKVVSRYERAIQATWLTSGSFQDILDGNLNKKRRLFNLLVAIMFSYMLPRYCLACCLYAMKDDSKRKLYQYIMVDYMETLGLVGRSLNGIYAVNLFPLVIDKFFFRSHEVSKNLEFLTEMLSLKDKGSWNGKGADGFTETEKRNFLSLMHKKLMVLKFSIQSCSMPIHLLQTLGLSLFLYKVSESTTASVAAVVQYIGIIIVEQNACYQIFTLLAACHVTVDYFSARIRSLKSRLQKLGQNFTEKRLAKRLQDYDRLMFDFKKRNSSLRDLLRNMCYFYCPELSLVMFLITVDTVWWMKAIILTSSCTFITCVIVTELYVGHLQSKVIKLYHAFHFAAARSAIGVRHRITFNTRMHLKVAIRELGSLQREGQHNVGLTNGEGAAFTTMDALSLTSTTISYTILMMINVYYS